ncbi:MAG TPA: SpoIID/LytB domain-containing protein, partial [Actinomycetota bacterium]|nr:SpoIID/LytB domain-containing protein [Actinomycetota bacterium]
LRRPRPCQRGPASARRPAALLFAVTLLLAGSWGAGPAGADPGLREPREHTALPRGRSAFRLAPQAAAGLGQRVRFVAAPGASLLVHGTYPEVESPCVRPIQPVLHARYPGTLEVGRDTDGTLFIIGILPFERYLEGIAEVPRTWPMEALKAQVVAARTYAMARMSRPTEEGARLGYQLCATDLCQVYRGLGVAEGPYGDRWRRAVRATRGEVLLYRGEPADTLYFSTSNGRTYGNEEVFGSDPLPYLRPRTERDDGASPVSRWRARIPLRDLARFLRAAGHWSSGPVTSVRRRGETVAVRGGGRTERLAVTEFRSDLNFWAPCLAPDRYPPLDGGSRLPQTVPSRWFSVGRSDRTLVLSGRGWGHGVGMVQWGAYGKARRGLTYREILAFYYGGLRPQRVRTPGRIRVGIAVGLRSLRVEPVGEVRVEPVGGVRVPSRRGPWLVTGGTRLRVRASGPVPRFAEPGRLLDAPARARPGRLLRARVAVPGLSVVRLALRAGHRLTPLADWTTLEGGEAMVSARVPAVPPGRYGLVAQTGDGVDIVESNALPLRVVGPRAHPSPTPPPRTPEPTTAAPAPPSTARAAPAAGRSGWPVALAGALGLLGAALALLLGGWARRRRRRS